MIYLPLIKAICDLCITFFNLSVHNLEMTFLEAANQTYGSEVPQLRNVILFRYQGNVCGIKAQRIPP